MERTKIVLIGAGSRSFGRGQIADVLQSPELAGEGVTLSLVDRDPGALELMTKLAARIGEHAHSDVEIESHTDHRKALEGASFVVTAVALERMKLWEQDYRVPLSYGFRHVLGENGGPGALFHALRSLELVIPICRDVERICPQALLLNFTNPEQRVLHAILTLTKVKAAGICHGIGGALGALADLLDCRTEDIEVTSAGLNHFYVVLKAVDKRSGADRLPEALAKVLSEEGRKYPPLFKKFAEVFGVFTFPSDDHIGEYVAWGAEYEGAKWPYGQESRPVRRPEAGPSSEARGPTLEDFAEGTAPLGRDILAPSGEATVRIICDIVKDRADRVSAVNVLNSGGYIENLPREAVVEVPATVDRAGLHPEKVGAIPEPIATYMRTQTTITSLVTEACRTRRKKLLLQALLSDPVVNSIAAAERMLDEMLELQRDFLPSFDEAG